MLRMVNGTVHIVTWEVPPGSGNERRFAVCETPVEDSDHGWCGALVDVTNWQVIRATDDCGHPENHRRPTTGPDAISSTAW